MGRLGLYSQPQFLPPQWKKTRRNNRGGGGRTNGERTFLLDEQKSSHPCDVLWRTEASRRSKRDILYICMCVWARVCTFVCVASGPKACISSFFADKSCPENRDATHQLLGQREPKLSVWHATERETGEGGGGGGCSKSMRKPKSWALKWSWLKPVFTVNFRPQCHA